jgi:hypothetical protein
LWSPNNPVEKRHFFVSRSGHDAQKALWLCNILARLGYSYHEQGQWPPGTNFVKAMGDAIDASEYTLALFSPRYFADSSRYTEQEWTAALVRANLIGVMIEPCRPPTSLTPFTYVDLTRDPLQRQEQIVIDDLAKLNVQMSRFTPRWEPPKSTARVVLRDLRSLPSLCDREDEETAVQTALKSRRAGSAVIAVVQGLEAELPEKFASRLEQVGIRDLLPGEPNVRPVFIPWPSVRTTDDLRMKLELAKEKHYLSGFAPEDAIVISTELQTEDQPDRSIEVLLPEFVRFWLELATGQSCLIVVCIAVRYPRPGWFELRLRDAVKKMQAAIKAVENARFDNCVVLKPLDSVPQSQARKWTQLPRVQAAVAIDPEQIDVLYSGGTKKIPLRTLMPLLSSLIETNERQA